MGDAPTVVFVEVIPNELGEHLEVVARSGEIGHLRAGSGPRVAGHHRVDLHEIRRVERRVRIVDQVVGWGRLGAARTHVRMLGAHQTHAQPDRRRARAAVEEEGDGPRRHVLLVSRVGDVEDGALRLPVVVANRHGAGVCRVRDRFAVDVRGVVRCRDSLDRRDARLGRFRRGRGAAASSWRVGSLLRRRRRGECERRGNPGKPKAIHDDHSPSHG